MTIETSTTTLPENQYLIKTIYATINGETVNSVDARELHSFLESRQHFADWIKAKVVDSPFFQEDVDYILLHKPMRQNGSGGHNRQDYALTQDTSKKLSMGEQTERGNEARDYFLWMEKVAKGGVNHNPVAIPGGITPALHDLEGVAVFFGAVGNQAKLSANMAVKKIYGIDCMSLVGVTHLIPEKQIQYFTPTVIGKPLGLSAYKTNQAIESAGLQTSERDHKNRIVWMVTEKGKDHCQLLDTNKKHSNGTPVMQIKWAESVVGLISELAVIA